MQHTDKRKAAIVVFVAGLAWAPSLGAQEAPSLPGGASSLTETYGDWRVTCQIVTTAKHCAMSQQQLRQDGQRVITVELQTAANDALSGNFVLPFGLHLDEGAKLRIDEQQEMAPLRFHTCLPAGCVVRVNFDAATVAALRAGTKLNISTSAADNGQEFAIGVPLGGFTAAFDRLKALTGT